MADAALVGVFSPLPRIKARFAYVQSALPSVGTQGDDLHKDVAMMEREGIIQQAEKIQATIRRTLSDEVVVLHGWVWCVILCTSCVGTDEGVQGHHTEQSHEGQEPILVD